MNESGVRKFLMALGVSQSQIRIARGWANAPCPMAPWTHGSGIDEHPSFGISVSDGRSVAYCFGCLPKAQQLEGLLHNIFIMSKEYPWEAAGVFIQEENHSSELQEGVPDIWSHVPARPEPLPKSILKLFPLLQWNDDSVASACKEYLIGRGIPEWVWNMYQVRYDPKRSCLVFPMTDITGRIFILRERSIREKKMWTVSPNLVGFGNIEFPKLKDSGVWFGMHLVRWSKPVMLVEGEIDTMRLAVLGEFNSIASATSSVSEAQIDALPATTIYLGYDADNAGALAHQRIAERIKDKAVMFELDWSDVGRKDPDELANKRELEVVMKKAKNV